MEIKAVVDRFENEMAILLFEHLIHPVYLPKKLLPDDCQEGDILFFQILRDKSASRKARRRISGLIKKLSQ